MTALDRFWAKVDRRGPDECWTWMGSRSPKGYGVLGTIEDGRPASVRAHRLSYTLNVGPIPVGLMVCHRCDNPPCVNPAHLWVGTASDNQRDAYAKGRRVSPSVTGPRGEAAHGARLTNAAAAQMRAQYAEGARQVDLAAHFGVSQPTVSEVVRGLKYRDAR